MESNQSEDNSNINTDVSAKTSANIKSLDVDLERVEADASAVVNINTIDAAIQRELMERCPAL